MAKGEYSFSLKDKKLTLSLIPSLRACPAIHVFLKEAKLLKRFKKSHRVMGSEACSE
uniref:Uncharacterized protein n=1 Tax=Pseudoalteromonas luteoviolacea TaxID=43657 RepID=A0A023PZ67_9GAMM|nr:hypothetical protein [Pseudoalteromonas luteoviolacea]